MIKNASATVISTWTWQGLAAIRQRYRFLCTSLTHKWHDATAAGEVAVAAVLVETWLLACSR